MKRERPRHFLFVRDYLQIRPFDHLAQQMSVHTMTNLTFSKDDPTDLINAAIEELICQRYELSVYNT
ncbi:DUF4158 domain-containing protein [Niallia sp. NCCP-28]|uniref:DUF4158 domain-containing protein n=1 Tax=Niallia TaxID=2837506 RepID=UPI0015F3D202|nr:DUF4158 domain-containing protein [Niallia sp. NCCP-28]GKU85124.1 hypothetical protein NCCP28_45200 [Niallia sp. NCCP-28]